MGVPPNANVFACKLMTMDSERAPLVTIGIPVYNAGKFLAGALQSIFAQTFDDWELIVVDDGSQDQAWEVVEQLHDERLRCYRDNRHQGLAARLNQIVALARGKYIARMDADDLCHPQRIARQIAILENHPELDAISSSYSVLNRQTRPSGWVPVPLEHKEICSDPLKGFGMVHPATIFRAEWCRRNPYNEGNRRCEDWELFSRTSAHSRFGNIKDCLYFYRAYDSFALRKYAQSHLNQCAAEFRQMRDYGALPVARSALRHLSHVVIYAGAAALNMQDLLIAMRSVPMPVTVADDIQTALGDVLSFELPTRERKMVTVGQR